MRRGCIAAAVVVCGFAAASAVPVQAEDSAHAPLRLQRFLGHAPIHAARTHRPARHRPARRHVAKVHVAHAPVREAVIPVPRPRASLRNAPGPITTRPKPVPTIAVTAKALTVVPAGQNAGFSAATEPWQGVTAFAASDAPQLPRGIQIVPADKVNPIDLAADRPASSGQQKAISEASLITPANAAEAQSSGPHTDRRSLVDWIYDKFADGLVTAALAIRSLLH